MELFLAEQQRLRVLKQNLLRRKRANLPAEKTLDSFDFGFQRSVSREQMLRLSDMTWVEQAFKEALNKSAAVSGSFAVTFRFENLEIHKVFLRFSNLNLQQNLSLTALAIYSELP